VHENGGDSCLDGRIVERHRVTRWALRRLAAPKAAGPAVKAWIIITASMREHAAHLLALLLGNQTRSAGLS
jgi:hypothetical protein